MTPAAKVNINAHDNTKAAFASVNSSLARTSKNALALAGTLTGIGTTGAIIAMAALTRNAIQYGSALTDAAKATGTGIEELQVLRAMADKAGAAHSTLEKAVIRLTKSTYDAGRGLSTAKVAFKQLNIEVETFAKLPAERKLETIARAIRNASDQGKANGAAMDLLGTRNAPALKEVLDDLAVDGFDKLARAIKNAGQIMTEETAEAMDSIADAMERQKRYITNFWAELSLNAGKKIGLFDTLDSELKEAEGKLKAAEAKLTLGGSWKKNLSGKNVAFRPMNEDQIKWQKTLIGALKSEVSDLYSEVDKLNALEGSDNAASGSNSPTPIDTGYLNAMERATQAQETFNFAQLNTAQQTAAIRDNVKTLSDELSTLAADQGEETTEYQNKLTELYKTQLKLATQEKREARETAATQKASAADAAQAAETRIRATQNATQAQETFNFAQLNAAQQTGFLRRKVAELNAELSNLASTQGEQTAEYQNKLSELYKTKLHLTHLEQTAAKEASAAQNQLSIASMNANEMMVHSMKNASDEMTDAFMQFTEAGKFEFDNMVSSMLLSIARLTFQQNVANPIINAAMAGMGSLFSGGGWSGTSENLASSYSAPTVTGAFHHTGGIVGTSGTNRSISANAFAGSTRYHSGGIAGLKPNEIPAVLEKGEEVLTQSDPRHRENLQNEAAGEVNITFQITANDTRGFDQLLAQRRPQIVGMINQALNRRGKGGI